jgi:hypothetical protein
VNVAETIDAYVHSGESDPAYAAWPGGVYACEAYGYILEHGAGRSERLALAEQFSNEAAHLTEESIEPAEVAEIVRDACRSRNGWRIILGRCTAPKVSRSQMTPVFGS